MKLFLTRKVLDLAYWKWKFMELGWNGLSLLDVWSLLSEPAPGGGGVVLSGIFSGGVLPVSPKPDLFRPDL